jgi:hypothetical protein
LPCSVAENDTPVASAGSDKQVINSSPVATLSGYVTDGCVPSGAGPLQWRWVVVNMPTGGNVAFTPSNATAWNSDQAAKTPSVQLASALGNYIFRLEARDGLLSASDECTVNVGDIGATLVLDYKFNDASDLGKDSSGKGHHGTVQGAVHDAAERDGVMVGNNGTILVPTAAFSTISDKITISLWIKGDAAQPLANTIFEGFNAASGRTLNSHAPWSNGNIYWDAGCCYNRINKLSSSSVYENVWTHLAFTKDNTEPSMKIYVNGALWHSGGGTASMAGVVTFRVGGPANNSSSQFYRGKIDDFRIYNQDLDDGTIAGIAAGN